MIWDCFMYSGEKEHLQMRCEELEGLVRHVLVEATVTHRGIPKPLLFPEHMSEFRPRYTITYVAAKRLPEENWQREHAQRDAAWAVLEWQAADDDWVLICDVDEIPSREVLQRLEASDGLGCVAISMRTCIFAVDWEVCVPLPPACVAVRMSVLRGFGGRLGDTRDKREFFPRTEGGWHLSWLGGPARQRAKLETATCHTELLESPEGELIRSGERYRTGADGGGLAVKPARVDGTWPAMIRERRCPESWFRPA